MNAIAQPAPFTDSRRQAKFLYWTGWRVTDIADYLGEKERTVHSWKSRDEWDRADNVERIGGALDAWPTVTAPAGTFAPFDGLDAAEIFRTSGADLVEGETISVTVAVADYPKCARSWRRVPDVGSDPAYPDLSARDADAVR